jgi:NAD-dependent deacetylase
VVILTQNVDDLHERAGSTQVLHLHGELNKVRSIKDPKYIIEAEGDVHLGDVCPKGGQLRPHIVWFGEDVPLMPVASAIASHADIFLVVGTSLVVYPAAGLVDYAPEEAFIYVVDPSKPAISVGEDQVIFIQKTATEGVPPLVQEWIGG